MRVRLYNIWRLIKHRCENPRSPAYEYYGGRGIGICDEWQDFDAFHAWCLASGHEKGLTIDRIDNNGDYSPDNCRWATRKEQSRNRRNIIALTFRGETKSVAEWAEDTGMNYGTLISRLRAGWGVERSLTAPVGNNGGKGK